MSILSDALELHRRGYAVIPIREGQKHPPLVDWKTFQTKRPTEEDIRKWFAHGSPNMAIVTGSVSGISVIDLDGPEGMENFKKLGVSGDTFTVKTPKGMHLYFKYTPELHTGAGFLPHVDVRSDGGYVMACPSVVGGKAYTVLKDLPLAVLSNLPEALKGKNGNGNAHPGAAVNGDAPDWVSRLLAKGTAEGTRNTDAARLAGYFHTKGHPADVIATILRPFADKCRPPMDAGELRSVIESITRYRIEAERLGIEEPPDFSDRGGAWVFAWPEHKIEIELDGVHSENTGVHAELLVRGTGDGVPKRIHGPVRTNLSVTGTRVQLVNYLSKRLQIGWAGMLESVAVLAIERIKTGDPVEFLNAPMTARDTRWLIDRIVTLGVPTILFGDGGTGKSLLALACAVAHQGGCGPLMDSCNTWGKAFYLDWESDSDEHKARLRQMVTDQGLPPIGYRRCIGPLYDQRRQIKRLVGEGGYSFIVYDSAGAASGGELESAEGALKFFEAVRFIGGTSLVIAHVAKNVTQEKPIGSGYWHNMARATWEMKRGQAPGEDVIQVGLFNRKCNGGRLEAPMGFTIRFTGGRITFEKSEFDAMPEAVAGGLAQWQRVEMALKNGPKTVPEIAEITGITESAIRTVFSRDDGRKFDALDTPGGPRKWLKK
ncbi:MAG: bifunctional DNA primase/polymerase [Nitrospirae bacterium]|nr:bifunctional DNA primase/polymerase [Nitrospirota bacterium]